jgi:D-alanyl-D-alanine dipeptidase
LRHIAPEILQDMRYAGLDNFTGQRVPGYQAAECILRRRAGEALKKVQAELHARSLGLKVYDCYRPARATTAFLKWMSEKNSSGTSARHYPRVDRTRLRTLGYISANSAHSRGLAVDLTLVRLPAPPQPSYDPSVIYGACTGKLNERSPDNSLDMGTGFDCFDVMAHAEATVTYEQRQARALLRAVMRKHGFLGYAREWWHFTFAGDSGHAHALDFPITPPSATP